MSYREEVLRTANMASDVSKSSIQRSMTMGALGLSGEAGEVADLIKKIVFHDAAYDREKLVKELGDVRWYFEFILATFGITMEEVEQKNIEKLRKRFPNGFSAQDAARKVDEK